MPFVAIIVVGRHLRIMMDENDAYDFVSLLDDDDGDRAESWLNAWIQKNIRR